MPLDIQAVRDKIRKLKQLEELLQDPEIASMVGATSNGVRSKSNKAAASGDGRIQYAEKAALELAGAQPFTVAEFAAKMKELGYRFAAKDEAVSTYGAMMLLKAKEILEIVEKGGPGKSAKWKVA